MKVRDTFDDDSTSGRLSDLVARDSGPRRFLTNWAASTAQGQRRTRNQDAFNQRGPVFAVADGMGGLAHGREAADTAVRMIIDRWQEFLPAPELRTLVADVNREILTLSDADGSSAGTTLVAVRVMHGQITIASIGDSRAYRLRNGTLELLTRDHNLRSELLDAGIRPSMEDVDGPLRALTSYLGQPASELALDVRSISVAVGDRLLLCSDGVHGRFAHADLRNLLEAGTPHDAAQTLASSGGRVGADDATAVVIDLVDPQELPV